MEQKTYKILIVEDDDDTANIVAIALRSLGFDAAIVNNGDDAIPKMKSWEPDIVVLDLELPGKNGAEILMEMFLDDKLKDLIIIANTVHMDAKDDLGFTYYTKFVQNKNEEPVMVNKLSSDESKQFDLRYVIGHMILKKFGALPPAVENWMKKKAALEESGL